ncbi:MAG: protein kinase domain-containing protein, partial [Roseiflexaceae bacterium]
MAGDGSFGLRLKELRRALDLTQEELAGRVGCALITIKKIETDALRPSRQIAERLAAVLEVPLDDRAAFVLQARIAPRVQSTPKLPQIPPLTPDVSASADFSGRTIKSYELRERIGAGGFGAVYRAQQLGVGRSVAVKIILPQYANRPEFIRRFESEAQIVARLEHPHIVPLYDYWRDTDGAYLVMRYIRGGSLQNALGGGPWQLDRISRLLEQAGAALGFAHQLGVVHRDIKPANILLDANGNAYLADFGIAKDVGNIDPDDSTQSGVLVGSPAYLSPEQIRDEPVTPQTDIYSLGIVLYELLAGAHPFADLSPAERLSKQLNEPLPSLNTTHPELPIALDAIIQCATAKRPADRYPGVLQLLVDWQRAGVSGHTTSSSGLLARTVPATTPTLQDRLATTLDIEPGAAGELTVTDIAQIENPYKGLRAFFEADAADFFGRETLTRRLLERMAEESVVRGQLSVVGDDRRQTMDHGPRTTDQSRFLAVVGPSGSGKSSVVRAGLIPVLRRGGLPGSENWFVVEMVPGAHPLEELEAALLRMAVNPPPSLLEQLQADERGLLRAVKRALPAGEASELLLVIDQFEEVFTLVEDEAARVHLLNSLVAAVTDPRSQVRVIVTVRADFYDRPLLYPGLSELIRLRTEVVTPLTLKELEQTIVGPAERVGLRLEPGLALAIVNDVCEQPGALPLLQYALTELFERREGHTLTLAAYRASGGVLGALARRADALYEGLDAQGKETARQLFLRLVTLGEGVEDTRRRVRRAELAGDNEVMNGVISIFGRYRLLTFDRDPITRDPTVEVAHEALIRRWGRLQGWLDESRDDLRVQRRLAAAAYEWRQAHHDPSFLAAGARLAQFEALAADTDLALNEEETTYLRASMDERDRREIAERKRQAHELDLQKRATSRLRYLVGALFVFLIVAIGLSVFAFNSRADAVAQRQRAEDNLTRSEAQRLAAEASALLQARGNADLIALLSIRSLRTQYTLQGDAALAGAAMLDYPHQLFIGHTQQAWSVAFSPDSRYMLTGSLDHTARLWDTQTGQELRRFTGHTDTVRSVAFSPDGKYVLTGSNDTTARLWEVATGHEPRQFIGHELRQFIGHSKGISGVAFSPDGKYVLTGSDDTTARLWEVATGHELRQFIGHSKGISGVAFSPDGKYVLTGSHDTTARLWNAQTGAELRRFTVHTSWIEAVAFSPDGRYVLTGGVDRTARLWDAQTGEERRTFSGHTSPIFGVAFSPDSRYVLTASQDRTTRLWDTQTGQELRHFAGRPSTGVAFSPDGRYLVIASADPTVRLWNTQISTELPTLTGHTNAVWSLAFSP